MKNNSRFQAIESAIDANTIMLIRSSSPPEACVDSCLGPYVTSILRRALSSLEYSHDTSLSTLPEYDSLVELLESQCQMAPDVARNVLHKIALVVQTEEPHINWYEDDTNNRSNANITNTLDTRGRSRSLGAEPTKEFDVNFLGKILQDVMCRRVASVSLSNQHVNHSKRKMTCEGEILSHFSSNYIFSPTDPSSNDSVDSSAVDLSPLLSEKRRIKKERHVSFDEIHLAKYTSLPQSVEQIASDSSLFSSLTWYSSTQETTESVAEETQEFDLEANFRFLDIEDEEDEHKFTMRRELSNKVSAQHGCRTTKHETELPNKQIPLSKDVLDNEALQNHPVSGFPDVSYSEDNSQSRNISHNNKIRSTSRRISKKNSSTKEAEELAATLFFIPSRPRSNSLMDHSSNRSTVSPLVIPLSSASSSNGNSGSDGSLSTNTTTSSSVIENTCMISYDNSAVIESTTQLLLIMNYNLGNEAASLASQITNGDLNLAQYLIVAARAIPTGGIGLNDCSEQRRRSRICRHELQGTCYRADCPYSHDLAGLTCQFWLKGRCHHSKGATCRFMHGFAESLLEGISEEYLKEQQDQQNKEEAIRLNQMKNDKGQYHATFVETTNLLQHNEWVVERGTESFSNQVLPEIGSHWPASFENGCWTGAPYITYQ